MTVEKESKAKDHLHWKCSSCGYTMEAPAPPEQCPSCGQRCEFINVSCYIPGCGGEEGGGIDPRLG